MYFQIWDAAEAFLAGVATLDTERLLILEVISSAFGIPLYT